MTNEELQSKIISFLRFPLIVGVVFIHSDIITVVNADFPNKLNPSVWVQMIINLFSDILPGICVPLFFFISGFLFFYRPGTYSSKLKKRFHTLLIPYLIWNFLGIISIIISHFAIPEYTKWSQLNECYNAVLHIILPYDLPPNRPLWFIRNLIYVALLSPFIKFLFTSKYKLPILVLVCITWVANSNIGLIDNKLIATFLFFSAGSYFSLNKLNIVDTMGKINILCYITYPVLVIIDLLFPETAIAAYAYNVSILTGIVFTMNLCELLIRKEKIQIHPLLTESSFFIFALHGLIISKIIKLSILMLHPQSSLYLLIIYFSIPILTIAISLFIYSLTKKLFPRLTSVLTGGRN